MAAAVGPGPGEGVVIQHPGHDIVNAGRLDKLLALEIVVVRHIQPDMINSSFFVWIKRVGQCHVRGTYTWPSS